jgi:hypothetical protein
MTITQDSMAPASIDTDVIMGYKLVKKRADGSYGPLFINARQRIETGVWLPAEDHPTKGFAHRPGWHATLRPEAPHLAENPKNGPARVWMSVAMRGVRLYDRPESQGGTWCLASEIMFLGEVAPDATVE